MKKSGFFKALLGLGCSSPNSQESSPVKTEETPKFLLPESAGEYLRRRAEIEKVSAAKVAEANTKADEKSAEAKALSDRLGTPVQVELNRREAGQLMSKVSRLHYEAENLRAEGAMGVVKLAEAIRREEREMIAHQGQTLYTKTALTGQGWGQTERRVVRTPDGTVYLCQLQYETVPRKTGKMVAEMDEYYGREERQVPELEPTGEFGPPTVEWVTSSLEQFSDEELKAIS